MFSARHLASLVMRHRVASSNGAQSYCPCIPFAAAQTPRQILSMTLTSRMSDRRARHRSGPSVTIDHVALLAALRPERRMVRRREFDRFQSHDRISKSQPLLRPDPASCSVLGARQCTGSDILHRRECVEANSAGCPRRRVGFVERVRLQSRFDMRRGCKGLRPWRAGLLRAGRGRFSKMKC